MHSNQSIERCTMQISAQRYCFFWTYASILSFFYVKKQQNEHFVRILCIFFDVYAIKTGAKMARYTILGTLRLHKDCIE